jgi:hypothetical protein
MANATTLDTIGVFKSTAAAIYSGTQALSIISTQVETLRKGKIVFGKSVKTCEFRRQLGDAMQAAFTGKKPKTYANYVTAFIAAVNQGIPFSFSYSKGAAAPSKGKGGKASDKTGNEKMVGALLNVWKLSEIGESTLIEIETIMADGLPLIYAIETVLLAAGEKLDGVAID